MATSQDLHFLLIPLMSQSHIIPLTDFAKLLASHGVSVTIITTPLNATRYKPIIDRAQNSGLRIRLRQLRFPCREAGLPDGCENVDSLVSLELSKKFHLAMSLLQEPLESLVGELEPRPSCMVATNALHWTHEVAKKFGIPRYVFHTVCNFTLWCDAIICRSKVFENVDSDSEAVLLPDMAHKIEFTTAQVPNAQRKSLSDSNEQRANLEMHDKMKETERAAQGILVNSFEELEPWYVEKFAKEVRNLWCIGPVSLSNNDISDKIDRGSKASISEHSCLKWLDSHKPNSVIYACFGSVNFIPFPQLKEIGLGLEASNRPFIWIIREPSGKEKVARWLEEEKFEERVKGRGLVIRGWAPQVLILSHSSVGGFLTHCGWNSTLEGITSGVPLITWPMFADQFYNEKLVVNVLRIGVRIGVDVAVKPGGDEGEVVMVNREKVKKAIEQLMEGDEVGERRERARELAEMAKKATEEGGSSYRNISKLIQDVLEQVSHD